MSWGLDRSALLEGRQEAAERVAANPWSHALECLGRAHRWLDEVQEGERRLREAAVASERDADKHGRQDAGTLGRIGSLWRLAGEREAAAPWFARPLADTREDDVIDVAAYCYLLDDLQAVRAASERARERWASHWRVRASSTIRSPRWRPASMPWLRSAPSASRPGKRAAARI